jgi:hypothetical protein
MKSSPYYPPRAGTLSRLLTWADRLVARVKMSKLMTRTSYRFVGFPSAAAWLLVPGMMWRGQPEQAKLGNRIMLAWSVFLVVHIVSLNGALADLSAAVASALHGISIAAVLAVMYPQWEGFTRVWKTTLYSMLMVLAIYTIALRQVIPLVAQRVTLNGQTIMTSRAWWFVSEPWKQGEWVVYRLPNGMTSMDRILALPGDLVRFHKDSFEVNGKFFQRLSKDMPVEGEIQLDENTYFIWPTTATYTHAGAELPRLLQNLAEVDSPDIVGRPYERWLWKSHTPEALKPILPHKL